MAPLARPTPMHQSIDTLRCALVVRAAGSQRAREKTALIGPSQPKHFQLSKPGTRRRSCLLRRDLTAGETYLCRSDAPSPSRSAALLCVRVAGNSVAHYHLDLVHYFISRDTTPHAHAVEEEVHTSHSLSTSAESSVSESPARISASLELVPGQERTEAFQLALLNPLAHPHDAVAH